MAEYAGQDRIECGATLRPSPMTKPARPNYLRTYRAKTDLTQGEVAYLMGLERDTTVSRHELYQRIPSIRTALLYEQIYETPVYELFAGELEEAHALLACRAESLLKRLEELPEKERREARVEVLTRLRHFDVVTLSPCNEVSEC